MSWHVHQSEHRNDSHYGMALAIQEALNTGDTQAAAAGIEELIEAL